FGTITLALCAGCYHATVETGAAPSNTVIHKSFASGWIFGLVPPSTIETQSRCPNGPAKVETQLTFVNQLVSFLTLSIYTPMEIKVTCAAPGRQPGAMRPQEANPSVSGNAPSATTLRPPGAERRYPPQPAPAAANARIRTNDELLASTGFRQAMTDVLRMRIVAGYREIRPDTLTVDLDDGAFTAASADYNLGRLYLAYRGTTDYSSEGALELLHEDRRVGLYTQQGLLWEAAPAPAGIAPSRAAEAEPPEQSLRQMPGAPKETSPDLPRRNGFWFNGGLGWGSLGCENCGGREGGLSGTIGLGGTVSQKVLLGLTSNGWTKSESGVTLSVGTLTGMIRFYPSNTGRFFLTGGLGIGSIYAEIDGFGSDTEVGGGALLGLGYDIRIGDNTSLTAYW
ncbi:MAG: Bor family protein, partial [bacterium]